MRVRIELVKLIYKPPVTMSHRVKISNTLRRLIDEGFVKGNIISPCKTLYELTSSGEKLYIEWASPLRTCKLCGKIAKTREELTQFLKDKRMRYGYRNLCKQCARTTS